jgi:Lon protease-like protein
MVVLPSEVIALHIFEQRYKDLLAWCQEPHQPPGARAFGIFFHETSTSTIGTLVRLRKVLKEYEDGRLDILVSGGARCRLLERVRQHAYDSARIELVEDAKPDWDEKLATSVFNLHRHVLHEATGRMPAESAYAGRTSLSFHIAPSAGMLATDKQRLLEMRSENDRLAFLAKHLGQLIARMEHVKRAAESIQNSWAMQALARDL